MSWAIGYTCLKCSHCIPPVVWRGRPRQTIPLGVVSIIMTVCLHTLHTHRLCMTRDSSDLLLNPRNLQFSHRFVLSCQRQYKSVGKSQFSRIFIKSAISQKKNFSNLAWWLFNEIITMPNLRFSFLDSWGQGLSYVLYPSIYKLGYEAMIQFSWWFIKIVINILLWYI